MAVLKCLKCNSNIAVNPQDKTVTCRFCRARFHVIVESPPPAVNDSTPEHPTPDPPQADHVAIAAGTFFTIGLKKDGTVAATGSNICGECDVGSWTNIVAVAAGGYHTVGLKKDGTVVAAGSISYGGDVGGWTDLVAIATGGSTLQG